MKPVSIVTPSTFSRKSFISILCEIINQQTYKQIMEWVIVDGSEDEDQPLFETFLLSKLSCKIPIRYVSTLHQTNKKIGFLRNQTNKVAKGEIIVCMDDDDYYSPNYVSAVVNALNGSKFQICSIPQPYVYEPMIDTIVQHRILGKNRGTNNTFAYKREYIENHQYDETVSFGEELSFTNQFSEPFVNIHPKHMLIMSHWNNTYRKQKLIYLDVLAGAKVSTTLKKLITNTSILQKFHQLFQSQYLNKTSSYDVCYYCGFHSIEWDPTSEDLGGSEKAIVQLTKYWSKMGKRVVVFGNFKGQMTHNQVDYLPCEQIPYHQTFPILILWRATALAEQCLLPIRAQKTFLDLHDNPKTIQDSFQNLNFTLNGIFLKSHFHQFLFQQSVKKPEKCIIIPNGVEIKKYATCPVPVARNPYRMCYTSDYTRGLEPLLKYFMPKLREIEPRAELHVYYGMNLLKDTKLKQTIETLLKQPGVYEYGRQKTSIINIEKHHSTFHLYYTNSPSEIDCIAIKESLVAGCIPILSNENLFCERDGLHFKEPTLEPESYRKLAEKVAELMNEQESHEEIREEYKKSDTIISWKQVATEWLSYF